MTSGAGKAADAGAAERLALDLAQRAVYLELLTPRELDVARFVAVGLDDKEIAERLVMALRTVEAHLRHIFAKLHVDRRSAVAFLLAGTLLRPVGAGAQSAEAQDRARNGESSGPASTARPVARRSRSAHTGRR